MTNRQAPQGTPSGGQGEEYSDLFFGVEIGAIDPDIERIIGFEEERQARKLIMIPSESIAPRAVREALGSVFNNVYAEGYPPLRMTRDDEDRLLDEPHQLAYYRRYADRRFYKGVDYVHFIETLAQRRAAACFANQRVAAADIYVNVQPLSGAAANLAVYDALVQPGDTVMGMDLYQGGHLTHGSEFNFSGKRYHVVSYGVSQSTGKLDYDEIRDLARAHPPQDDHRRLHLLHLGARLGGVRRDRPRSGRACCWPISATRPAWSSPAPSPARSAWPT